MARGWESKDREVTTMAKVDLATGLGGETTRRPESLGAGSLDNPFGFRPEEIDEVLEESTAGPISDAETVKAVLEIISEIKDKIGDTPLDHTDAQDLVVQYTAKLVELHEQNPRVFHSYSDKNWRQGPWSAISNPTAVLKEILKSGGLRNGWEGERVVMYDLEKLYERVFFSRAIGEALIFRNPSVDFWNKPEIAQYFPPFGVADLKDFYSQFQAVMDLSRAPYIKQKEIERISKELRCLKDELLREEPPKKGTRLTRLLSTIEGLKHRVPNREEFAKKACALENDMKADGKDRLRLIEEGYESIIVILEEESYLAQLLLEAILDGGAQHFSAQMVNEQGEENR